MHFAENFIRFVMALALAVEAGAFLYRRTEDVALWLRSAKAAR